MLNDTWSFIVYEKIYTLEFMIHYLIELLLHAIAKAGIIILILQLRKQRLINFKLLAQGQNANMWLNWV